MLGPFRKTNWQRRTTALLRAAAPAAICVTAIVVAISVLAVLTSVSFAQQTLPAPPATALLPEPIYWKQNLFLIPYQWSSAADTGAAQSVILLVSKDGGVTWQKISEAKPQVKAFNYHAEGDGQYWFAIRTVDRLGRLWPDAPYQPELRVVVDTTMPRIDALSGTVRENGVLEIDRRAIDTNIDPSSWKVELQNEAGVWQPLPLTSLNQAPSAAAAQAAPGIDASHVSLSLPPGSRPTAIRATVADRAGNSAAFQSAINSSALGLPTTTGPITGAPTAGTPAPVATTPLPPFGSGVGNVPQSAATGDPFQRRAPFSPPSAAAYPATNPYSTPVATAGQPSVPVQAAPTGAPPVSGWVSALGVPAMSAEPAPQATALNWPAGSTSRAPFRLSGTGESPSGDVLTTYGNPSGIGGQIAAAAPATSESNNRFAQLPTTQQLPNALPLASSAGSSASNIRTSDSSASPNNPSIRPLEPFREVSMTRLPATEAIPTAPVDVASHGVAPPRRGPTVEEYAPGAQSKLVGSRTFDLEYELDDVGRWGVSRVELWGTRDGGRTWRSFARDDDHRSPLRVTVDEEGTYGFRIVVEGAGGPAAMPPQPGDAPELWVAVDLKRPVVELTSVQPGTGNLADHLILSWRAADENLDARPISLFYSSRPAGPWSAVATSLENNGEYAWRVERHIPPRVYLRVEARDTAGNLGAYQTLQPVEIAAQQPTGHIRAVEPIGPTAAEGEPSYR